MLTANNYNQNVHVVDKSALVEPAAGAVQQAPAIKQKKAPVTAHFGRYHKKMETDVIVKDGILRQFRHYARSVLPQESHLSKNYVVTDSIVDELYGDMVLCEMRAAGLNVDKLVMPADACDESGESSAEMHKSLSTLSWMIDSILDSGIDKHSCIVSLGGGVVNNLCGFLASSLYRGISLVHITTTMMGQADAAIDFKQAVNHPRGKNLVGSYYPACKVVCDPATLTTLSDRHLLNGLSECIKHAITQSPEMLEYILAGIHNMRDTKYLEAVVRMTVEHKAPTLTDYHASDFNEMCPQYGHAIGHAVEHLSWTPGYGPALLHGEAIAIGMCVSAEIAYIMDLCDESVVDKHYEIFEKAGLPVYIPSTMTLTEVLEKLTYDKHYLRCKPTMGLVTQIGNMHLDEENKCYGIKIDEEILNAGMEANIERRQ
ncbi:2-deoxy-scyllo-inosose synthase [Porphyridium purpureum]|uniref:2-deoxy-scyllo-inosose synthase n=1 Tax=Porphyridium purpureum TaxID=35688 RepID=A0A5J4YPB1_PORPP|nr:2-deoxy-scyllo-inosose synthase [Porphyridium purpureum]|eukprot:POR1519..scf249_10